MKGIVVSVTILLLLARSNSYAQKTTYKEGSAFSFVANVGPSSFASSLAWNHLYGIGKSKRFKVGYGLRLTNFFGSDLYFATAPAKYTSGKSSIAALFTENIIANIDSIGIEKVQTNFLNAGIYLQYTLPFCKNRINLGVNIDAIGFTVGSEQDVTYKNRSVSAKPTGFNVLLISDSDKGSLNSEWYVAYNATPQISIKGGYQFLFTEYTTTTKIQQLPNSAETNDRFRLKSPMILFGVIYQPFAK